MHVTASVQARLGSTRLPGKVLFHLGERRLLKWVIDRAEAASSVDEIIATIGDSPENDAVTEYCKRSGLCYLVGPEEDLLARHLAVVEESGCDLLVRITADCPFVPSEEIDRVVEEHLRNDARYTTNNTDAMPTGTAVDALEPDLLSDLAEHGETHPVERLHMEPDDWKTAWTANSSWEQFEHVHMAVDTPSDYWFLTDGIHGAGDSPRAVAKWIAQRVD